VPITTVLERVQRRVETDLPSEELQDMVDEALVAIEDRYGPPADSTRPITVTLLGGGRRILDLSRPVDTAWPVIVQERYQWDWWFAGETVTNLASTEYRILNGGRTIERLGSGLNGGRVWGREVAITYVPVNDADARQEVAIKLVIASIQYQALNSESVGDSNQSYVSYSQERESLLGSLAQRKFFVA
jgi:hypothetical protein